MFISTDYGLAGSKEWLKAVTILIDGMSPEDHEKARKLFLIERFGNPAYVTDLSTPPIYFILVNNLRQYMSQLENKL